MYITKQGSNTKPLTRWGHHLINRITDREQQAATPNGGGGDSSKLHQIYLRHFPFHSSDYTKDLGQFPIQSAQILTACG